MSPSACATPSKTLWRASSAFVGMMGPGMRGRGRCLPRLSFRAPTSIWLALRTRCEKERGCSRKRGGGEQAGLGRGGYGARSASAVARAPGGGEASDFWLGHPLRVIGRAACPRGDRAQGCSRRPMSTAEQPSADPPGGGAERAGASFGDGGGLRGPGAALRTSKGAHLRPHSGSSVRQGGSRRGLGSRVASSG